MDKIITKSLSLSLFTMPAFVLTVRHGANISAIIILILSLIVLLSRYPVKLELSKKEKILIFSLLLLPIVIAFDVILRDLRLKYLDYYLRLILAIPIFFALREIKVELKPLFIGILIGAIGAGIFAIYQKFYLNEYEVQGFIFKINYGNISILLGFMSLASLFLASEVRFKKTFYVIALLAFTLGVIGSLLSGARGGWVAVPFFIVLFFMYFPASRKIKITSIIMLLLGMVVLYSSSIYIKKRVDLTYNNTKAYFSPEKSVAVATSTGTRLELWKTASIIFTEHPVLGIGSGQFKQALKEKIDSGEVEKVHLHTHVHNEPLQILVITGIVGLLAYLTLYGGVAYYFYTSLLNSRNLNVRYLSFIGMMIIGGFFMFGLTNYSFAHHVMALFFSVMVVVFAGMISSIENTLKES